MYKGNVSFIDNWGSLCDDSNNCVVGLEGKRFYDDEHHLNRTGTIYLLKKYLERKSANESEAATSTISIRPTIADINSDT